MDDASDHSRTGRKPRADAERNRERVLSAAKTALTRDGAGASLEDIARDAGVGIGTLYRHFPNRQALLTEVYRGELEQLCAAAPHLLDEMAPLDALERWLRLFVDYFATKRLILQAMDGPPGPSSGGSDIREATNLLMERARDAGSSSVDVDPYDMLLALAGVAGSDDPAGRRGAANQMISLMMQGLRR